MIPFLTTRSSFWTCSGESNPRSTIELASGFFAEGCPVPETVSELFTFSAAVYCLDKVVPRELFQDAWTRHFEVSFPVSQAGWETPHLTTALNFLTGDYWQLSPQWQQPRPFSHHASPVPDVVCLFSGGLDSLIGAIELLESGLVVRLVAHHETGIASSYQHLLCESLQAQYGKERVALSQLFLRPSPPKEDQYRPLPPAGESSTRARSLLFIAGGMTVAAALGEDVPLLIPENGFIGLNVPLSTSRIGSLSTRTTHPHFIAEMQAVFSALSIRNPLVNPYRLLTKGEMLKRIAHLAHARELARKSISCAHPEALRWRKQAPGNCGYCYPCLIRRSSMHTVGWDYSGDYALDALGTSTLLKPGSRSGADLRALLHSLARGESPSDHLRSGPLPPSESRDLSALYIRGRTELRNWLESARTRTLVDWISHQ